MFMSFRFFIPVAAALLASCGGGGGASPASAPPAQAPQPRASSYQHIALVNQTEDVLQLPGFDTSFLSVPPWVPDDPVTSVARQTAYPGDVGIVMSPEPKKAGFGNLGQYLAAASGHPNVKYFYVYDEMFFENGAVSIGAREDEIDAAARTVQSAGYKAAVTIMANVILDRGFRLKDPGDFDAIAIDLYPSALLNTDTGGCTYNANPYTTLLYCSIQRLRAQGYTGQIWYAFQAFALKSESLADLLPRLQLQQETIAQAPSLGVVGVIPYGLYWSLPPDSPFVPGHGSPFEPLVDCRSGC
jgi:hypothetical protein